MSAVFGVAFIRVRKPPSLEQRAYAMKTLLHGMHLVDYFDFDESPFDRSVVPPGNSWRLAMTIQWPVGDGDAWRPALATPWTSPVMMPWDDDWHALFCLQSDKSRSAPKRFSRLLAVRGPGSAFDYVLAHGLTVTGKHSPNAILVSEVANSQIPWMKSGDLDLTTLPPRLNPTEQLGLGSDFNPDAFLVGFADLSVWAIDTTIPWRTLEKFLTTSAAREVNRDEVLGPYRVKIDADWIEEDWAL